MVSLPLRPLLASVVDYAGTFPPAGMSLKTAMAAYATYQKQPEHWLLGKYVLSVADLPAFIKELLPRVRLTMGLGKHPSVWPISLVLRDPRYISSSSLLRSLHFYTANSYLSIAALEISPQPRETLENIVSTVKTQVPQSVETFFEVPLTSVSQSSYQDSLRMLQAHRAMAKVRTGGLSPKDFPTVMQLAQFIATCEQLKLPFKATAGLHQPFYSQQRLPNGSWVNMHGFLNIAIATALTHYASLTAIDITHILQATSLEDFIPWFDDVLLTELWFDLCQLRKQFFRGFGSCSFQEPLASVIQLQRSQTTENATRTPTISNDISA